MFLCLNFLSLSHVFNVFVIVTRLMCRARRFEAHIQQMLWKVNFCDIVFVNTVCLMLLLASDLVK